MVTNQPPRSAANETDPISGPPEGGWGKEVVMSPWPRRMLAALFAIAALLHHTPGHAGAEIKLDKDFLNGVVAKLPPTSFDKADKYRGTVHSYRLIAIDPRTRRLLVACQIEGSFTR